MKRFLLCALALASVSCTPDQLDHLGVHDPGIRATLLALDDRPIRMRDGSVLELDGSITPPPPATHIHPWEDVQRWYAVALGAGWTPEEWLWVSCVMGGESNGWPNAHNRRDPSGGSRGLMQINGANTRWLRERGIIVSPNDLFDPWVNLRAANEMYRALGPGPWGKGRCR